MQQSPTVQDSSCDEKANAKPSKSLWPDWTGETVVCIATGPSLTAGQLDFLKGLVGVKVIAVSEAGLPEYHPLSYPWADILYSADNNWWRHYRPRAFGPMFVSGEPVKEITVDGKTSPAFETVAIKCLQRDEPMPREPGAVLSGDHSGFQALGLALTLGASRIVLLGYDAKGAPRNAHTNRPAKFTRNEPPYANWCRFYDRVPAQWPDVEIINCSPRTGITAFPQRDIREVFP